MGTRNKGSREAGGGGGEINCSRLIYKTEAGWIVNQAKYCYRVLLDSNRAIFYVLLLWKVS